MNSWLWPKETALENLLEPCGSRLQSARLQAPGGIPVGQNPMRVLCRLFKLTQMVYSPRFGDEIAAVWRSWRGGRGFHGNPSRARGNRTRAKRGRTRRSDSRPAGHPPMKQKIHLSYKQDVGGFKSPPLAPRHRVSSSFDSAIAAIVR
jgi:hypothetical protein